MICLYLRSSSIGTHRLCEQQYFLQYVLGMPELSNKRADIGTIVHKAMECLALYNLATKHGEDHIVDDELGKIPIGNCSVDELIEESFDYYTAAKSMNHHKWTLRDLGECKEIANKAVNHAGGLFDPRNRNIIMPEQRFDIEIKKPWAKYKYETPEGEILEGYLAIKGTIDLITYMDSTCIEAIDWKTGQRKDWATGKRKEWKSLNRDHQLRLYHYALSHLYPDIEDIYMSIFFITDGGVFTVPFCSSDLTATEMMLQQRFEMIKRTQVPRLLKGGCSWKCRSFCHFGKRKMDGTKSTSPTTDSICKFIKDEVEKHGIKETMRRHGNPDAYKTYKAPGSTE